MNIEKRGSSWRIRQMVGGKTYTVTIGHKPSKAEAEDLIHQAIHGVRKTDEGSFQSAAMKYTQMKENVLSPRSVKEYYAIPGRLPEWFTSMKASEITQADVQRCINELSIGKSPKTVSCYNAFICSVLAFFYPQTIIHTTLPQKRKIEAYMPSEEDVRKIVLNSEGTRYHIPIQLACYGLRRSEICALELSDLDNDDVLHVSKALVENKDKQWVIKTTKTTDSTREVPISHELADEIRKQGYVFNGYPQTISNYLAREQKKMGMHPFSVHKLRHFFASKLLDMGCTSKDIMALGGWKTDNVMKTVYQHTMKDIEGKRRVTDQLMKDIMG